MKDRVTLSAASGSKDLRIDYYWAQVRELGKKYKNFDWPSVRALLRLVDAYDGVMVHFSKLMSAYKLSPAVFNVLMILSRGAGEKFKQHDISKLLLVSRANVTGLVNVLARKGLAKREPDPTDRRAWLVRITPRGQELLEAYLPSHYAEVARIFSEFTPAEKKAMDQFLCKFKNGIH